MIAVDLFAGPGGWDVGARGLGIDPLGIEWDTAACRVREAAGLKTLQADVSELDPAEFPCDLLIASPPCTAFSMADKGEGRAAIDTLLEHVEAMGAGVFIEPEKLDEACGDSTAHLVLEPLRWALALNPATIVCEQVPPALPMWEAMEPVLRARGYFTWSGVVSSERYGVPQTRKRAFLIASKAHPVGEPAGSHQRYVHPRGRDDEGGGLFDLPMPDRIIALGDEGKVPWVSMAEALGWAGSVGFRLARGAGMNARYGERPDTPIAAPSPVITEKARTATWQLRAGTNPNDVSRSLDEPSPTLRFGARCNDVSFVSNDRPNATARTADEPAPTITGGHDSGERVWVPTGLDRRQQNNDGSPVPPVTVDRPSPTLTSGGLGHGVNVWVGERPATTVQADPRISEPGWPATRPEDYDADGTYNGKNQGDNAVRVTIEQAACLQGFPDGYPWEAAGSRSKAFQCIGNAVPPPMAQAVLVEALGLAGLDVAA